jgi:hypothetical protein
VKNRAIWVGLGLLLAVAATIVWSLARMSTHTAEAVRTEGAKTLEATPAPATLESPVQAPRDQLRDEAVEQAIQPAPVATSHSSPAISDPDTKGVRLFGFVTDTSGRPLHPDELLCPGAERPGRGGCSTIFLGPGRTAEFEDDGRYSIPNLPPGTLIISLKVPGYRAWEDQVRLLEGEHERRFDIALEPSAVLRVRVVIEGLDPSVVPTSLWDLIHGDDASAPLRCVILREPPPDGPRTRSTLATEHGLVRSVGTKDEAGDRGTWVHRESIELQTALPVFAALASGDRALDSRRVDSTEDEVLFRLTLTQLRESFGGIRFQVVDDQGQPTTPQVCRVIHSEWRDPSLTASTSGDLAPNQFSTSNPGEVRIRALQAGPLAIQLSLRGYARVQLETVVEPGIERDLGEVRLERNLFIRGNVLNADGSPADADVECQAVRPGTASPSPSFGVDCQTDSRGHFVIDDAGRGDYVLRARAHSMNRTMSMPMLVSTEAGSVDGIVIRLLDAVAVTLRLEKMPRTAIVVRIEDAAGLCVASGPAYATERKVYAAFELPGGHYTARAFARGEQIASMDFTVGSDPMRLVLAPP